ncbi:OmpA family protein [Colwellia sp. 12G3]|uniref:OmpA family protein n=1 Tax=Colwellia sp. 12G3 TaxID=2058299 RepID=UPI000C31D867|nr:OmpA family protein [Colwellia sp. 12G3]PKI12713.1 hypothetical protein CXF71_18430 [Colwellia sp. 12G3]
MNHDIDENSHWLPIADMMSALMMVFLFIAIFFMYQLQEDKAIYSAQLNKALHQEFDQDLARWQAEITPDNILRFSSPFSLGSSEVPVVFMQAIKEFFPRYIYLLTQHQFKKEIDEIRVEGHTSYGWGQVLSEDEIYLKNMRLSQNRASNVLAYTFLLDDKVILRNKVWLKKYLRANGMAFSQLLYRTNGVEDSERSRRVEFRVLTKES